MTLSQTDIYVLVYDLCNENDERRTNAERIFVENKAEIMPLIAEHLNKHDGIGTDDKRGKRQLIGAGVAVYLLGLSLFLILYNFQKAIVMGTVCPLVAWGAYWREKNKVCRSDGDKIYKTMLKMIGEWDQPHFIGYLIDVLCEENTDLFEIIEPLFYGQLRLMKRTDAARLKGKHYHFLRGQLLEYAVENETAFDEEKALAILAAFEQIGTMKDVPTVSKVEGVGYSQNIRDAARECRCSLEVRQREETAQNTLLRASQNRGGQEELLRAVKPYADTQAETLLRVPKEE